MSTEAQIVFEHAAGVSAVKVSYVIRSLFCAMFLIWGAWNVYGLLNLVEHELLNPIDLPMTLLRVLCLCALVVVLVFIK